MKTLTTIHSANSPVLRPLSPATWKALACVVFALITCPIGSAQASTPIPPSDSQDHWAYRKPEKPHSPKDSHPIDFFIEKKLSEMGWQQSDPAPAATLIRRLHLDLTGLTPTLDEVNSFIADPSEASYLQRVDDLLNSPHFGEKWARHWLDAARYADSDGFEKDKPRQVWQYRDWVIRAFNQDMPYNQFIIEQIAGDLLPNASLQQRIATGFLRNSMINEEGGIHPEQFRMEAMFDRMDAIGKGVLGLTVQCAQCHDHKFDPISQKEYYQMFAFLNDSAEGSINAYTPTQYEQRKSILKGIASLENQLKKDHPDWESSFLEWQSRMKNDPTHWQVLKLKNAGDNAQRYYERPDGSLVAAGYAPTRFQSVFTNKVSLAKINGFRLELITDPDLPAEGPGRSEQGIMALTEFKVDIQQGEDGATRKNIPFTQVKADFANTEKPLPDLLMGGWKEPRVTGPASYAIDGDDKTAWGIDAGPGRRNQDRTALFISSEVTAFGDDTKFFVQLRQMHGGPNSDQFQNMNLGRFRISVSTSTLDDAEPLPYHIRNILEKAPGERSKHDESVLFSFWRRTVEDWKETNEAIEHLWSQHPEGGTQLVLNQMDPPRKTYVLKRGDFLRPEQEVVPGVLNALHPIPDDAPRNRLTFARWLVDDDAPTTARSIVNRVWQSYFGIGLVETSEDLGVQSPAPSHPELLDWLAVELMKPEWALIDAPLTPWSLKHIHRLIVTSNSYRQHSAVTKQGFELDPYNRYLARGPRFRMDAELIRDTALKASGLLQTSIGGPSVFPPAPDFLFTPPASYGPKFWGHETGANKYRRALYTFRYRSVPYPVLEAFDAPNGDFSCVRRTRSNTPLQALAALNEPLFMECAQSLARETLEQPGDVEHRLAFAFRRCVARSPSEKEIRVLKNLLNKQTAHIREGWVETRTLAGLDKPNNLPGESSPTELAAWTTVARVLLNLDETMTKE